MHQTPVPSARSRPTEAALDAAREADVVHRARARSGWICISSPASICRCFTIRPITHHEALSFPALSQSVNFPALPFPDAGAK